MPGDDAANIQWLHEIVSSDPSQSPHQRIQATLLDSIIVSRSAFDDSDSYSLIQAGIDFVNWALQTAFLVPGEFPQQAMWGYYCDYYRAQVSNGGHAQFVSNSRFTPLMVGCCLRGLRAMGATEHLAIFEDLAAFVEGTDDQTLEQELDRKVEADRSVLKALDKRYFAIDSTQILVSKCDAWLRGLDCLRTLPVEDWLQALEGVEQRNTLRAARSLEAEEKRRAYQQGSATYRVIKSLCTQAGRTFVCLSAGAHLPMRMVSPAAPDRREFCWGLMTDSGVHHVFFYEDKGFLRTKLQAQLWLKDALRPAASATLSGDDYQEIVPGWVRSH